jgi:coenzyme PQQ precursor peptide PqqA
VPRAARRGYVDRYRGKEVAGIMESLSIWETPEFEEFGVAPEVTMYVAQLDD